MKSIATINFKGGVGKTTITWLLAKYMSEKMDKKVLVVDTDAQMSLTLAVELQESGLLSDSFDTWYNQKHIGKNKTLLDALHKYDTQEKGFFDFPIDSNFMFQVNENLHFIPSIVDLYWLELGVFDREKVKFFISALLGKLANSDKYKFDYVFFDCPPNFTALSYSVLCCSSLILIPVNPDVFASKGVGMMIDGLKYRIEPWPNPRVAVFMNKAKTRNSVLTKETARYWDDTKKVCIKKSTDVSKLVAFNSYILDRVDIKRAIPSAKFPKEFESDFSKLALEIDHVFK